MTSTPCFNRRGPVMLGLLAALSLAGCGQNNAQNAAQNTATSTSSTSGASDAPSGTSGGAVSDKPFRVAYNQWIGFSGVLLAKDKGYFKEAGLNVEFKQFAGPADGVPPLVSGQLEAALTTADTPILLSKEAGEGAMANVMAIDMSNGADGVVAGPNINSMADLKGKTIAATKGQVNEFLLLKALESAKMSASDVKITNMDADAGGAAVLAGKVPAAVTWEPWLSKARGAGGKVIFSSAQVPNLLLDVATVSQSTLRERPADVRAFVAAALRGNEQALKNPAEAAKIAKKYFGTTEAEALAMLKKVKLYSGEENRKLMADSSGPLARTSSEIARFFVAQKVMDKAPAQPNLFNGEFLPGAASGAASNPGVS